MVIGYILYGQDNNLSFFANAPKNILCLHCGSCLDTSYYPKYLPLKKEVKDVSFTYDGRLIVSEKFKTFCDEYNVKGIEFFLVNEKPKFYFVSSNRFLNFDVEKRETRFENLCPYCSNYESVIGATPAFLKDIDVSIKEGFYRTDIEFGSGSEKSPLFIIGLRTKKLIMKQHFKGIEFEAIKKLAG